MNEQFYVFGSVTKLYYAPILGHAAITLDGGQVVHMHGHLARAAKRELKVAGPRYTFAVHEDRRGHLVCDDMDV